ncbi:MAG TPA: hypothetical protein VI112_16075, partial [Bacteroidia bacterium]
ILVNKDLDSTRSLLRDLCNVKYDSLMRMHLSEKDKKNIESIRQHSDSLIAHIERIKTDLLAGPDSVEPGNYDYPTHFMMEKNTAYPEGRAGELKREIDDYRNYLFTFIPKKTDIGLSTKNVYSYAEEEYVSWEYNAFYHDPTVVVVTILGKLQNDVQNAETLAYMNYKPRGKNNGARQR